ncbi:ParB family protein [Rodentibacter haemolyticus]|uniref:ParB N-terminal domain-containing protein n=1 Tax=Rodentibacter haemolyticus TaxID=2778911 RepID=A0ABX6UZJ6_9PAST|nr:ParB family protein [Rodentibacter haemolyticus]QPB42884.1 ParB N-terminal domain-containing protein [Rodentibacter haemolyticus]
MKNPFVPSKDKKARAEKMMAALSRPAIMNNSPEYEKMVQSQSLQPYQAVSADTETPNGHRLITITLDQLRPYEGNPRRTKNPAYEDIKASIKSRGLDHAPNVTQRPGDNFYTILDGGNTRLQALNELFKETRDRRFWSIECIFKPWQGEADDINSQLNILIGHLAENDVRGDLSFIEKALGIREVKSLYEKKYGEYFSHRKLAEKLGENGYPISYSLIAKMEQCLTYLYPHIPNVLLNGMGKPQIEKLLTIRRNAQVSWEKQAEAYPVHKDFDMVWMSSLTGFDEEPDEFVLNDFQDQLIGNITEAFSYQVPYETFKFEIDLAEQKFKKLVEKQPDILQRTQESEIRVEETMRGLQSKREELTPTHQEPKTLALGKQHQSIENDGTSTPPSISPQMNIDDPPSVPNITPLSPLPDLGISGDDVSSAVMQHFSDLGLTPGVNPEKQRQEEAELNGLEFSNCGKQPVTNIWKIHPNRKHKMEAYSLALDIAEEVGLGAFVEHVHHEPIDYSYRMRPLDGQEYPEFTLFVYHLLTALATESQATRQISLLNSDYLTGNTMPDLMLVRLFRLIRLYRYINAQQTGGQDA